MSEVEVVEVGFARALPTRYVLKFSRAKYLRGCFRCGVVLHVRCPPCGLSRQLIVLATTPFRDVAHTVLVAPANLREPSVIHHNARLQTAGRFRPVLLGAN